MFKSLYVLSRLIGWQVIHLPNASCSEFNVVSNRLCLILCINAGPFSKNLGFFVRKHWIKGLCYLVTQQIRPFSTCQVYINDERWGDDGRCRGEPHFPKWSRIRRKPRRTSPDFKWTIIVLNLHINVFGFYVLSRLIKVYVSNHTGA